ncbi:hypothetical protein K7432_011543 [Basidiobolus ranarum]|uniref:Uncharacterized protein n=1 Tax=Basidiobolus ranarum TaxID=34480 RepID=A0ABR2VTQ3_9FUNG
MICRIFFNLTSSFCFTTLHIDNYLFNAGKGAVFTKGGKNELEASIMDGSNLKAGACTLLTTVKNPISLARQVMVQSPHNFLGGEAAEQLANKSGLDIVEPKYFFTEHRWKQHLSGLESPGNEPPAPAPKGTVGAVALDQFGNIATATSTGGKTNKWDGRIGDTPMIGAGTYADNETCGVSGTGDGEFFIRHSVAYNVCARMKHLGESVETAARNVVEELRKVQGVGGVVALDRNGNVAMPFNSDGMYRGYIKNDGVAHTYIFNDE